MSECLYAFNAMPNRGALVCVASSRACSGNVDVPRVGPTESSDPRPYYLSLFVSHERVRKCSSSSSSPLLAPAPLFLPILINCVDHTLGRIKFERQASTAAAAAAAGPRARPTREL